MHSEIKHNLLKKTLDDIAASAPNELQIYHPAEDDKDAQIHKYSRAQIHLFLRVWFGLLDFRVVENQITDGTNDGGLDAYYVDKDKKIIYFIQSKYKITPEGYLNHDVDWREFFKMELDRIVQGEAGSISGNKYNGKVRAFQTEIKKIPDIARWNYKLVYLGNVPSAITKENLLSISGGVCQDAEVLYGNDFYNQVLIPYLKHDFYNKEDFSFEISVNQDRAANRIRYSVDLANNQSAEVQLFFVPTIEIARLMSQYRNSILRYNPRCYVGIRSKGVNAEIKDSVLNTKYNEFSLLNNGITIVCKEVSYNDNTARRGQASIIVSNPQIVNGGQTAFTLAHLYENDDDHSIFEDKEVLTKFIRIEGDQDKMIEKISDATNSQNPITPRDKVANDIALVNLQSELFDKYGILFERKRGEFYDSMKNGLVDKQAILDSAVLMRLLLVYRGSIALARSAGEATLFKGYDLSKVDIEDLYKLICIFKSVKSCEGNNTRNQYIRYKTNQWGNGLRYGQWAVIYAVFQLASTVDDLLDTIEMITSKWKDFENTVANFEHNHDYMSNGFDYANYYKGKTIKQDLDSYLTQLQS